MKNTVLATLALLLFAACNSNEKTAPATETEATEKPKTEGNTVFVAAEKLKHAGIETGHFSEKNIPRTLAVSGEIALHPEHVAQVTALSDGVVSSLRVSLNQNVRRGELVAVLRKADLLDLQQQFLETRDRAVFLQTERDRLEILKNADATASKNFQKAEAELRAAQTTRQVLAAKLRQFQIDPDQLSPENLRTEIQVLAPVSGVVTAVLTNPGAALAAGGPICSVADLGQLHADFWVFEKDISAVKIGQSVSVLPVSESKNALQASIFSIDPTLNPEKKAVRVHARFSAATQQNLTAGVFSEGQIAVGAAGKSMALPSEAIVREGEGEFVFLKKSEDAAGAVFEKVAVRTLGEAAGFVAVEPERPIPGNAQIVLRGAYYISAEGAGVEVEE